MIIKSNMMNKHQLHNQLMYSYPSYRKFFALIDAKSALCFWENYPSPKHVMETTPEKIYETIKPVHQALKMERIHEILAMIEKDGDTRKDYQTERDFIVKNIVKEIHSNNNLIAEIDI